MPWYAYVIAALVSGMVLAFWGWVAVSIIALQQNRIKLGAQLHALETACAKSETDHDREYRELLEFVRRVNDKQIEIAENVARIAGKLDAED